jgi:hypothetical protein
MTVQKRLITTCTLLAFASIIYGAGRHYSPALIRYVVEQSLIQKAPSGANPTYVENRMHAILSKIPDRNAQTQRLLQISEYLEKVQFLTSEDLDSLMARAGETLKPDR